ncbi:hypothetical protein AB0N17_02905 [Streptomyces sp. NPDC051133]|uniref:hypothetical protein n=1 Tax=Streptomyces sp. NPDC051133 TaxID=3155521 RepID=UPI00342C1231
MANPQLTQLQDAFAASSLNAALWNSVTGGAATLDTVNDLVTLAVPTTSGATNTFGSTLLWDATSSSVYAQVGVAPNGNGGTKTALRLFVDSNNSVAIRLESGVFKFTLQTAGTTVTTTLPTYDPHQHRWWQLRETGGSWAADTSPDGLTWTNQVTSSYSWAGSATGMQFVFQTGASTTEVSGNTASITNLNVRGTGPFNPNWPTLEDAWAPYWGANAGSQPLDRYVEVTDRTRGSSTISRGRQYELDQVRSGEAGLTLANTDAALDPTNASGPWAGHIQPYQPFRKRAQWPPTRNLLDQAVASGGDAGGYSLGTLPTGSAGVDIGSDTGGGSFISSTSAWQGSVVMQFSVPSGSTAPARICHTPRWSPIPGQTYTMQMRVRDVTASTSLSVQPFIGWFTAGGGTSPTSFTYGSSATLTGSTTAGWTLITVTATAPANVAGMDVGVALAATAAAIASLQVDGWQLEKGATATTWQCPGVWFPLYAGWTERWPSQWDMAGTYGTVQPTTVDSFSLLSQQQLSDPLTQEINSHSPRFVYKLDDPAGSLSATDWTGNYPPAQLAISKYGAGSLVFGTTITATDSTGLYTGSSGTVATLNNSNPGTNLVSGGATFLKLTNSGIKGPTDPTLWTRVIAFRYTGPMPVTNACLWSSMDAQRSGGNPSGSHIYVYLYSDGKPVFHMQGPTGTNVNTYFQGATNCVDGDWHFLAFGYNQALNQVMLSQDGSVGFMGGVSTAVTPTGIVGDNLGGFVDITVGNGTIWNWKGDLSFAAEFSAYLTTTPVQNMYNAWKAACAGESSDARYARILRYAGYTGSTSIQTGLTTSMGPAAIDGQDAMSALQAVVDTENGEHYVDRSGAVTFKSRSARYNATTPVYVFGENTAAGEWPYEDCTLDYDSTHLSNQVTVTQESSSQNFYATDATSVTAYFPRTMSRTINSNDTGECQDAANYLLSRYKQPATRVSSIKLHPSANPALWAVCLSLELGTRVRVMRRPPNLPVIQVDCFVENIQWDLDDAGEAWVTLQCSPADLTPYGIFASFHTTLASSTTSGVTTITINAGADNTNPAAAQIGQGQQLVLGLGTATQETVTVLSVASTSAGWSTVAITLQAATTASHTAGDLVCEPLPSGVTDPTMYDSSAKFDAVNFAY